MEPPTPKPKGTASPKASKPLSAPAVGTEVCVSAVIYKQETSPGLCTPDFDSLLSSLKCLQIGNSGSLHKHKQAQRTKRNKLFFS